MPDFDPETVKATLEQAREDVGAEMDRAQALDAKLTSVAGFSGVSLSISGAVGAGVVVNGDLPTCWAAAVGVLLVVAIALLLGAVVVCFSGLSPKDYHGLPESVATARVRPDRLRKPVLDTLAVFASTYYTRLLPEARKANNAKVDAARAVYRLVALGFGALGLGVVVAVVGAVA